LGNTFTVFSTAGWLVGQPEHGGDVQHQLELARQQGARYVAIDRVAAAQTDFNVAGLGMLVRFAGLEVAPDDDYAALGPRDVFITSGPSQAPPCGRTTFGTPVYYELGSDVQPVASADNLYCPSRSAQPYAAPGPPAIDDTVSALLRRELVAAQAQGADTVYFQETVPASGLFGGAERLRAMARTIGLGAPADGRSANTGPDGVTVQIVDGYEQFASMSCGGPLPGDRALVLLRGPIQTLTLNYATNLYCPTRSPDTFVGPGGG
jgi:hypothetical protein